MAAVAVSIVFVITTRHGLSLDGDAATYLDLARSIRLGNGPTLTGFGATEPVASAHFPPLYPAWLAVVGTSRWANLLLYLLTASLVVLLMLSSGSRGLTARRSFGSGLRLRLRLRLRSGLRALPAGCKPAAARVASATDGRCFEMLVAAVLMLHPDVLRVFAAVSSESLFLPLMLGAVAATLTRRTWLVAVLVAAALLTRHVGVALLVLPMLAAGLPRWKVGLAATVAAVGPYLLWRAWLAATDALPDREIRWHPPTRWDWVDVFDTFGRWAVPQAAGSTATWIGVVIAIAVVVLLRRQRVLLAVAASYTLTVLLARTFVDAAIPMGGRMWTPLLLLVVAALVLSGSRGLTARRSHLKSEPRSLPESVGPAGCKPAAAWVLVVAGIVATQFGRRGDARCRTLPPWFRLHLAAVARLADACTRRDARRHQPRRQQRSRRDPRAASPTCQLPAGRTLRHRRSAQYAAVRPTAQLRGQGMTFVYFDDVDRQHFMSADDVRRYLTVDEVRRFDDGLVLRSR